MSAKVEKALLIASRGDGPWMPVIGLEEIEVEGMGDRDLITLESEQSFLYSVATDGVHSVNLAEGKVRVCRQEGLENRITVRARCER